MAAETRTANNIDKDTAGAGSPAVSSGTGAVKPESISWLACRIVGGWRSLDLCRRLNNGRHLKNRLRYGGHRRGDGREILRLLPHLVDRSLQGSTLLDLQLRVGNGARNQARGFDDQRFIGNRLSLIHI